MYAHTVEGLPTEQWQPLDRHLVEVQDLAGLFARAFASEECGRLAGLWHDLGKYAPEFQRYLERSHAKLDASQVNHSTAGALHAQRSISGGLGLCLAFAIAGHHAGLADYEDYNASGLRRRLAAPPPESYSALQVAPPSLLQTKIPCVPPLLTRPAEPDAPLRIAMFTRMLFSCLVDADRLATESFVDPRTSSRRVISITPTIVELRHALDQHLATLHQSRSSRPAPVDVHRAALLSACRERASQPPGLFTLTAPTGCGKTFASMAFALGHAETHGLRRVIYALPFTSVTEQNAAEFRRAFGMFGEAAVLEHHSAYAPTETDEEHPTEIRRRLLAENWDAPVVVTTNVRLLETLFASRPSDARRLHRVARSVVVLDEAQAIPVHLLKPTLAALQELIDCYDVSVVLASATMPAITSRPGFPIGLRDAREIVLDPDALDVAMRRTRVHRVGSLDDDALVERMTAAAQALVIVNTRKHAARLFTMLRARGVEAVHLSALMCPVHRADCVTRIKSRLATGAACRVVSTQVIEAGVDVDFPLVLRAMAGLDSIIQSAGRCNREGRNPLSCVEVFETDETPSPAVRAAAEDALQVLEDGVDPLALDTIRRYFALHYWSRQSEWDGGTDRGISRRLTDMLRPPNDRKAVDGGLKFRTAADLYRVIDPWSATIVVPYGQSGKEICEKLVGSHDVEPADLRRAQKFTVSVSPFHAEQLVSSGVCTLTPSGVAVADASAYDCDLGLLLDRSRDPEGLIG